MPHGQRERNADHRDKRRISHSDVREIFPSGPYRSYEGKDYRDNPDGNVGFDGRREPSEEASDAMRAAQHAVARQAASPTQHQPDYRYDGTPLKRSRRGPVQQRLAGLPSAPSSAEDATDSWRLGGQDDRKHLPSQVQHPNNLAEASDSEDGLGSEGLTSQLPSRGRDVPKDGYDEPDANRRQSFDKGSDALFVHHQAADSNYSTSSNILPVLDSRDACRPSLVSPYWDTSVFDANRMDRGPRKDASPRSQTWNGSYPESDRDLNKVSEPDGKDSRGVSNFKAWAAMSSDDRNKRVVEFAERGDKQLPPLPPPLSNPTDGRRSIPRSSTANHARFDIQDEEDFAKIFDRRLFNEASKPLDKDLKDCFNSVSKTSRKLAFDILLPYIKNRTELEEENIALRKIAETHEEELNSKISTYEIMLSAQSQELKGEKDREIEELEKARSKEYGEVLAEKDKEIAQLTKDWTQANADLEEKHRNFEGLKIKIAQKDTELDSHRDSIERRDKQIRAYEDALVRKESLNAQQEKDIVSKAREIEKHELQLRELCRESDDKLRRLKDKAAQEKAEQEAAKEAAVRSVMQEANEEMSEQEAHHQIIVKELEADLENYRQSSEERSRRLEAEHLVEMQSTRIDHAAIVQRMQNDLDEAKDAMAVKSAEHNALVHELQKEHNAVVVKLKRSTQEALEQIEKDHHLATAKIHQDRQEANSALLNRDNNEKFQATLFQTSGLPRKTDAQIRDSFVGLQQLVESLGRSAWKKNQPEWTQQLLRRIGNDKSTREFRRAVVQDAIWATLFEFVFESPFRIFGDAGKELEQQWVEHSGEGMFT